MPFNPDATVRDGFHVLQLGQRLGDRVGMVSMIRLGLRRNAWNRPCKRHVANRENGVLHALDGALGECQIAVGVTQ